jgi:hypothetical protein
MAGEELWTTSFKMTIGLAFSPPWGEAYGDFSQSQSFKGLGKGGS